MRRPRGEVVHWVRRVHEAHAAPVQRRCGVAWIGTGTGSARSACQGNGRYPRPRRRRSPDRRNCPARWPTADEREVGADAAAPRWPTMFSTVPYLVSPVTWRGRSFHRNRVRHSRSSAGWLSCTSAGVTRAVRMIRACRHRPRSDRDSPGGCRPSRRIGVASGSVVLTRKSAVRRYGPRLGGAIRATSLPDPVVTASGALGQVRLRLLGQGNR